MGKKKSAASKLAKMSDEERARYLQHRADIEEEARRRKQQLIAIFLKNKLKREEALSRLNMAKINQEWRAILRNIKCAELRKEAKNVQTYFNNALMRKNQTIDRLLVELDEAEETYATMLYSHMENIDKLIVLHSNRLSFWRNEYENEKNILLTQYTYEMDLYKGRKFKAHKELESVFYGLESAADEQREQTDRRQLRKIDDLKSKMILRLQTITKEREDKVNLLWHEFQSLLKEYSQQTEEKYTEYVLLRDRDNADTKQIHQHYLEIERATNEISSLKSTLESQLFEHKIHVNQLNDYRKLLQEKQTRLKNSMENGAKIDKERLKQLVIVSTKVNAKFDKLLAKGKNILLLTSICSKLETEREKIQPFNGKSHTKIRAQEVTEREMKKPPENFKEITLEIMLKTENFWIRYNNAEIDCACLDEEHSMLKKENALLKEKLREYLTNIAVSNGRVGSTNERMRPNSMKVERVAPICDVQNGAQRRRRPVTCIEGNLSVAIRSKKLVEAKPKTADIYSVVN